MHLKKLIVAGIAAIALSGSAFAATIELAGVKVEDSATVAGTKLQLNGAGIRVKLFKIYVGSLYTSKTVKSLQELVAAPGPKRMSLHMLREADAGVFGKLLTRGVEDNVPKNQLSKLVPGLIKISDVFTTHKSLSPGDVILMDWIPGTGMVLTVKGKVQGEPYKEPEFFAAMMSIWFGESPGDWKLKDALLGLK